MNLQKLILASAFTAIATQAVSGNAEDNEMPILRAEIDIKIGNSYMRTTRQYMDPIYQKLELRGDSLQEGDCFFADAYQKALSRQFEENKKNIDFLYKQDAVGVWGRTVLSVENRLALGNGLHMAEEIQKECESLNNKNVRSASLK